MRLFFFGAGQALSILLVVVNIRAIAKDKLAPALVSEFAFALTSFFIIHYIATDASLGAAMAYGMGAVLGTALAMHLTRRWDS